MTVAPSPDQILAELRVDIDRIDAAMHGLLMERGGIIERLIGVKARQGGGSAFRPGREAEMMRRLAERHEGPLPLDTAESIWRVIIATFTFVQAPYAVQADVAGGDAAMRDTARFHFGFTVPLHARSGARAVIDAVAAAPGDLGLLPVAGDAGAPPWWPLLVGDNAPKIIARLPFVERTDHPAGLPVFVIAKPSAAAAVRDVVLVLVSAPGQHAGPPLNYPGATLAAAAHDLWLVALPGAEVDGFLQDLRAKHPHSHAAEVGSHAARFDLADSPNAQRDLFPPSPR